MNPSETRKYVTAVDKKYHQDNPDTPSTADLPACVPGSHKLGSVRKRMLDLPANLT